MPQRRGLIVADDLSGANDTGHQLACRGFSTTILTDATSEPADSSVVVVNTDSRYVDPAVAASRVADATERYRSELVYKKVDSTLRGNLVPEITAMVQASDSALAVVAPAFPSTGRITIGGVHLVDGTPVAQSPTGGDADQPVEESHLPTLLADGPLDVSHVSIDAVASGRSAVLDRIRTIADSTDPTVVAFDAATDDHLATIAAASAALERPVTYVGSGGLANHVQIEVKTSPAVLGVAGSASPRTFEQLSALADELIVEIDGRRAIDDSEAVVDDAARRAGAVLDSTSRTVVTAALDPGDVDRTIDAGKAAGLTEAQTRDRIATVLGRCASAVCCQHEVGGLFVTGGTVATAALDALNGTGIRLTGHAVEDGVPLGRICGGDADGLPLVTKAGAFGKSDSMVKALDYLAQYDGRR